MPVSARSSRLAALVVCALLPAAANARLPTPRPPDSCGNPALVNDSYESHWGKVVEVVDPVTVVVECVVDPLPKGHTPGPVRCVHETLKLVQLEPPPASSPLWEKARRGLERRTLGRVVDYAISHFQETRGATNVILNFADPENERLLRQGLASYRDFGDYAVDWYTDCVYKRLEAEARAARRGIWARGS
ncbi:MAG TPA: thermonuclease family protein [Thermoanaerobaculia bacterium]|jgi:hypothetical protein|nr:thermonuclease family protein [Thermoanaerobaculia bacterium]